LGSRGAIWQVLGSYPGCGQMVSSAGRHRISPPGAPDARAPHRDRGTAPVEDMG